MSSVFVREGDGFFYAVPVTSTHLTVARGDTREECEVNANAKGYDVVDESEHVEPVSAVLHLCAPNDRNGNPRRLFAVIRANDVVAVYDEGYRGVPRDLRNSKPFPINVPASEYTGWVREAKEKGRFYHS